MLLTSRSLFPTNRSSGNQFEEKNAADQSGIGQRHA
jgi:hypothetical protein